MSANVNKNKHTKVSDSKGHLIQELISDLEKHGHIVGIVEASFCQKILNRNITEIILVFYDKTKNHYTFKLMLSKLSMKADKFLTFIYKDSDITIVNNTLSKRHMKNIKKQAGAEAI